MLVVLLAPAPAPDRARRARAARRLATAVGPRDLESRRRLKPQESCRRGRSRVRRRAPRQLPDRAPAGAVALAAPAPDQRRSRHADRARVATEHAGPRGTALRDRHSRPGRRQRPKPRRCRSASCSKIPTSSCSTSQPGWWCIPRRATASGTLVNALLHHVNDLSGIGGELRPGIVHRLDRGTSGLMVVAKNDRAHQELSRQFQRPRGREGIRRARLGRGACRAAHRRADRPRRQASGRRCRRGRGARAAP